MPIDIGKNNSRLYLNNCRNNIGLHHLKIKVQYVGNLMVAHVSSARSAEDAYAGDFVIGDVILS
jgi:hypothetical protein